MEKPVAKKSFPRRWHAPKPAKKTAVTKIYISAVEVRQIITHQLGAKLAKNFGLYMGDDDYFCTPLKDAEEIIANSAVDRHKWVAERFDCDDFALVLKAHFAEASYANGKRRKAHCFGIVWGNLPTPHAINWMINDDKVLRFVEPQKEIVFAPRQADENIFFMLV